MPADALSDRLVHVRADPPLQHLRDHAGLWIVGIAVERHALAFRPRHDPAEDALQVARELQSTTSNLWPPASRNYAAL